MALLETDDVRYIAAYQNNHCGCMNSALFCEELAQAMLARWPDRFIIHEMTPVTQVILRHGRAEARSAAHGVKASAVVLCTNGFEGFRITDDAGEDIDTKYHRSIKGKIGYMAAFLEPRDHPPAANYYQDQPGIDPDQPYFYMTRRPYDMEAQGRDNLISVGGPQGDLPEETPYERKYPFKPSAHAEIDAFMSRTYRYYRPGRTEDAFFWHGLMGYTPNGIRAIGPEPCNPALMYNLGCNGIGLLHSIHGGDKIARIVRGEKQEPSMFDPPDKTCPPAKRLTG